MGVALKNADFRAKNKTPEVGPYNIRVDEVGRSIIAAAKEIAVNQQVGEEQDVLGKVEQLQLQVAGLEQLIRQLVKKIEK